MSDGFAVEPGALRAHAEHVAQVEVRVGAAVPGSQTLSDDAYGVVGQVFAGAAVSAMATGSAAVADLRRALVVSAGGLRAVASDYENADLRIAGTFGGDG
ncbi:MAG: hypothetical protein L0I76_29345 [Pseudonocardia sp.]|nr:hypothetical protein [Pseudonocardia sp.]